MPDKNKIAHVLTLVGPPSAALEERLTTACLRRASLDAESINWLSQTGDLHAVEALLDTPNAQSLADLRVALSQVCSGAEIDGAILPAANRKKRLLICDMDSTIIEQECLDELADFAGLKDQISEITERAMRGELDFEAALTQRVSMLKGLDLTALKRCYAERITLMPGARELVATMRANRARCVLVSGGFTYFTLRIAEAAGFQAHRGNVLLDDGHALTGEVGKPILGREAKLIALKEEAKAAGCATLDALAIGDGANDLAMIREAGLGIAYRAKPIVSAEADAAIVHADLRAALFFQGYRADQISSP